MRHIPVVPSVQMFLAIHDNHRWDILDKDPDRLDYGYRFPLSWLR